MSDDIGPQSATPSSVARIMAQQKAAGERMSDIPAEARKIPRDEFDAAVMANAFAEGPWVSSFGDGHGEPYVPLKNRRVWGVLRDGGPVFAEGVSE